MGMMCNTLLFLVGAKDGPCHRAASKLSSAGVSLSQSEMLLIMAIKGNGGESDFFLPLAPAGQPQGSSSSRSRGASHACYQPVPLLSQGTDSVSATSVLCTFVKDMESHFKTMKTC